MSLLVIYALLRYRERPSVFQADEGQAVPVFLSLFWEPVRIFPNNGCGERAGGWGGGVVMIRLFGPAPCVLAHLSGSPAGVHQVNSDPDLGMFTELLGLFYVRAYRRIRPTCAGARRDANLQRCCDAKNAFRWRHARPSEGPPRNGVNKVLDTSWAGTACS